MSRELDSIISGHWVGARVVKGDVEFALRKWKKRLKDSGALQELKAKQEYTKPSVKRRQQILRAKFNEQHPKT